MSPECESSDAGNLNMLKRRCKVFPLSKIGVYMYNKNIVYAGSVLSVVLGIQCGSWNVSPMVKGGLLYCFKCLSYDSWVCLEGVKYHMVMNIAHFPGKFSLLLDSQRSPILIFS